MKYTEAFIALGATYPKSPNQRSAVNQSERIFAFWESPDGKGDRWRAYGSYIQVSRDVGGPWTSSRGGQIFYKSILDAFHTRSLVKVVKYRRSNRPDGRPLGGPKAADPMMYGGQPMVGRVQIQPNDAVLPEQIRKIDILLMPVPGATGGSEAETMLFAELVDRGVPAMVRMILEKQIIIEKTEVPWIHSELTVQLKSRLTEEFPKDNIFVESELFGEKSRADVVREESKTGVLHFYEVKTSTDSAKCERASIGQLLEYYAIARANGRVVGSITTVGIGKPLRWIGRSALSDLSVPWEYLSIQR